MPKRSLELKLKEKAKEPAITKDGKYIKVKGNLEFKEEVRTVLDHGAEGVGLYRTELLYLVRKEIPSEQDYFEAYKSVVETVSLQHRHPDPGPRGRQVLFSAQQDEINERNPVMGLRAIRLCLKETDIFRTQLRGILRASHYGNTSIMSPMISGIEELETGKGDPRGDQEEPLDRGHPLRREHPGGHHGGAAFRSGDSRPPLPRRWTSSARHQRPQGQYSRPSTGATTSVNYLYEPLHPAVPAPSSSPWMPRTTPGYPYPCAARWRDARSTP